MKWKCSEYYEMGTNKEAGKPKKLIKEALNKTLVDVFKAYMSNSVSTFIIHNYRARF
jgi:hypothetical protein